MAMYVCMHCMYVCMRAFVRMYAFDYIDNGFSSIGMRTASFKGELKIITFCLPIVPWPGMIVS